MGSREELWAMQQRIPPGGKIVLYGLANYSGGGDEFGEATRVNMDHLTELTGYPVERVQAILDRLIELGFMVPEPEPYPYLDYDGPQFRLLEHPAGGA